MVSAVLLCCGVLCWPCTPAAARLRRLAGDQPRRWRAGVPRPSSLTFAVTAALVGWLLAGVGGAVAAVLGAVTVWRRWRNRGELHRSLTAIDGLAEAVRSLVAGLRAGAHPADAATAAAADAQPPAAGPMRAIAAAARLDGDIHRAIDRAVDTTDSPALGAVLARVSRAWTLAQRHGLPLADVLEAVGRDLDQRARFARQVLARMAGPRASATTLAILPALGIVLGEAMGAHPMRVLTGPGIGHLVLLLGVALLCAGVAWCGRLTGQVVPR